LDESELRWPAASALPREHAGSGRAAKTNLTDHAGVRLTHGKPKVNGVEIHYALGGAGEPVFLLHGTPKTMSYWRHVVPHSALGRAAGGTRAILDFFAGG
jgi:hypothetical protein